MYNDILMRSLPFSINSCDKQWVFIRPADPDEILNRIQEEEFGKDEFMPYWAEFWPASHALFNYCADRIPSGRLRICELGCGLGVVATACAVKGHQVFATDISFDACRFTVANMQAHHANAFSLCADWRHAPFSTEFDIVLGADILYEERWVEPVSAFINKHVCAGGKAIIADPQRKPWTSFKEKMQNSGFQSAQIETRQATGSSAIVEVATFTKK